VATYSVILLFHLILLSTEVSYRTTIIVIRYVCTEFALSGIHRTVAVHRSCRHLLTILELGQSADASVVGKETAKMYDVWSNGACKRY